MAHITKRNPAIHSLLTLLLAVSLVLLHTTHALAAESMNVELDVYSTTKSAIGSLAKPGWWSDTELDFEEGAITEVNPGVYKHTLTYTDTGAEGRSYQPRLMVDYINARVIAEVPTRTTTDPASPLSVHIEATLPATLELELDGLEDSDAAPDTLSLQALVGESTQSITFTRYQDPKPYYYYDIDGAITAEHTLNTSAIPNIVLNQDVLINKHNYKVEAVEKDGSLYSIIRLKRAPNTSEPAQENTRHIALLPLGLKDGVYFDDLVQKSQIKGLVFGLFKQGTDELVATSTPRDTPLGMHRYDFANVPVGATYDLRVLPETDANVRDTYITEAPTHTFVIDDAGNAYLDPTYDADGKVLTGYPNGIQSAGNEGMEGANLWQKGIYKIHFAKRPSLEKTATYTAQDGTTAEPSHAIVGAHVGDTYTFTITQQISGATNYRVFYPKYYDFTARSTYTFTDQLPAQLDLIEGTLMVVDENMQPVPGAKATYNPDTHQITVTYTPALNEYQLSLTFENKGPVKLASTQTLKVIYQAKLGNLEVDENGVPSSFANTVSSYGREDQVQFEPAFDPRVTKVWKDADAITALIKPQDFLHLLELQVYDGGHLIATIPASDLLLAQDPRVTRDAENKMVTWSYQFSNIFDANISDDIKDAIKGAAEAKFVFVEQVDARDTLAEINPLLPELWQRVQAQSNAATALIDEGTTLTNTYMPPAEPPVDEEKPQEEKPQEPEETQPEEPEKPEEPEDSTDTKEPELPETGDASSLASALMALAGAAVLLARKRMH